MGAGISKHGGQEHASPAKGVRLPALPRPNPLYSTEVQERVTTTTRSHDGGGDDAVPPPVTLPALPPPHEQPSGSIPREGPPPHADGERSRKSNSPNSPVAASADEHAAAAPLKERMAHKTSLQPLPLPLPPISEVATASPLNPSSPSPSPQLSPSPHRGDGEAVVDAFHQEDDEKDSGAAAPPSQAVEEEGGPKTCYRSNARSVSPAATLTTTDFSALPLTTLQTELRHNHRVLRVCLTGGPCAGKSTMLAEIQAKIPQRTGYQVYCVPEAATLLVTGGMKWDGAIALEQQLCLLRTQLALEDQFYALAVASGKPTIVISDRGTMDGRAFCAPEDFQEILRRLGSTLDVLRDRYDAIIHMVTAACGAEQFYNLDNPARYEDLDGARASDAKLQQMYVGHPVFRLLDNSSSFDDKVERGLQLVSRLVGLDGAAMQRTSHFLVRRCPAELPVPCATFRVRTVVLSNSQMDEMRLVQMRVMADGSRMHFFKSVRKVAASQMGRKTAPPPSLPPPPPSGDSSTAFARRHTAAAAAAAGGAAGQATPRELSAGSSNATQKPFPRRASVVLAESARSSLSSSDPRRLPLHGRAGNLLGQTAQDHVTSAVRISSKEYACLVNNCDPHREVVEAETTHFIFAGTNFEVTTLLSPAWVAGKQTLTAEYDAPEPPEAAEEEGVDRDRVAAAPVPLEIPDFIEVDREVPLDGATTAFLISHKETGPLYTSLAFAPVFTQAYRGGVSAIGPHADVENFLHSTLSTPKRSAPLRGAAATTTSAQEGTSTAAAAMGGDGGHAAPGPLSERKVNQMTSGGGTKAKLKLQPTEARKQKAKLSQAPKSGADVLGNAAPPPITARHDPAAVTATGSLASD